MRLRPVYFISILFLSAVAVFPAAAKEGIHATVLKSIPACAGEGSHHEVSWTLSDKDDGRPFNASKVFIRLIGPTGETTEAFARYGDHSDGYYTATVTIPSGGVDTIKIGVAGMMRDREGHSERSDWLMVLANDPIRIRRCWKYPESLALR